MNDRDTDDQRTPEARSQVGGRETWDLTGPPSAAAFDIPEGKLAAIYESEQPRDARFLLPGEVEVDSPVRFVDFTHSTDTIESWTWSARTPEIEPGELVEQVRLLSTELGLDDGVADELRSRLDAAAPDSPETIRVHSNSRELPGGMRVSVSATIAPNAGTGRLDLGGVWPTR